MADSKRFVQQQPKHVDEQLYDAVKAGDLVIGKVTTVQMTDQIKRPRTAEEYAAFHAERKHKKRREALKHLEGKTVKSTLYYDHSKSGDIDIVMDDGSWLHISANGEELEFGLHRKKDD